MSVVCRPARAQDLECADALVVSSINDLTGRHGFGPMAVRSPAKFQLFSLEDDADGLWVAEEGERILGFAWSWVCGDMWFLAQLFVSPDHQGRNIGNELIKRTLDHAEKSGATNRVLITFSFNTVSQGLYIRHGLFPRFPIYSVSASRERLVGRLHGSRYGVAPLEEEPLTKRRLAQADERVLGVSREKHHSYLINDGATKGFNLYDGNRWTGYAYVDAGGHIGPLAVMERHAVAPALRTVLHLAAESGSPQISAFLPGASETALNTAMEHGMRIKFPMLLMSSREFGSWGQYLPRNPGFM
ncbi:GNAT family N-acetyltransferase [Bradyrhizobium jicamae]|uniref:GNAT family N-acetyltransferase n=1 Tax=Bradyrhizobium jicamae TaxID=280332 RepID=A0ABS5FJ86_9BRAD|nr:GNAT family N-acetyltransferase [Bradyrhizobium jicamae]MBR0796853.1 GNAT family N-acetyltransferase [Bradyrhizobium jicamae]MBR0935289.1 GNAT family N-acetyltransferase [Bradyrhizobium jicamae]